MKQHGSTVWRATVRPLFSVSRSNVGSQHVIGFISTVYFRFNSDFLLFLSKYLVFIPIVFHNKCSTPNRLFWLNINSVFSSWSYVAYHMSHMVYSESSYLVIRLADRLWYERLLVLLTMKWSTYPRTDLKWFEPTKSDLSVKSSTLMQPRQFIYTFARMWNPHYGSYTNEIRKKILT